MIKKSRLLALFFVVLTAVFVTANVAGADNGSTTTQFTVAYDNAAPEIGGDPGLVTCDGNRIVKTGPKPYVKDSETCVVTGQTSGPLFPAGTSSLVPDPGPVYKWFSDYELFVAYPPFTCFRPAVSGTITVKNKKDGTSTWTITAYYDPSFTCL